MTHCGAGWPVLWLKTFGRKNGNNQLCTGHGFLGVGAVHLSAVGWPSRLHGLQMSRGSQLLSWVLHAYVAISILSIYAFILRANNLSAISHHAESPCWCFITPGTQLCCPWPCSFFPPPFNVNPGFGINPFYPVVPVSVSAGGACRLGCAIHPDCFL